jgi:hypothetical protein
MLFGAALLAERSGKKPDNGTVIVIEPDDGLYSQIVGYLSGLGSLGDVVRIDSLAKCSDVLRDQRVLGKLGTIYARGSANSAFLQMVLPEFQSRTEQEISFSDIIVRDGGIEEVVGSIGKTTMGKFKPDVLYPSVHIVAGGEPFVVKRLDDAEEARINLEALAHYSWTMDGLGLTPDTNILVGHLLGPETKTLNREIKRRLGKGKKRASRKKKKTLKTLQEALLHTQIVRLVEHQTNPFVPRTESGDEIVTNPNLDAYYSRNVYDSLQSELTMEMRMGGNALAALASGVFSSYFPSSELREVRYLDLYPRNHGLRLGKIGAGLDDVLEAVNGMSGNEVHGFVFDRFRHFDVHRIVKKAYDLEDFWHIVDDPSLGLSDGSQLAYHNLFIAARELGNERKKLQPNEKKVAALEEIMEKKTVPSSSDLKQVTDFEADTGYFYAMKAYRNIRWFGLVDKIYLGKYKGDMETARLRMVGKFSMSVKSEHEQKIAEFKETGNLNGLRFALNYLTKGGKRTEEQLLATGVQYDQSEVNPEFYNLFEGETITARKRKANSFVRWLNRYAHSRTRHASYKSDRHNYATQAEQALKSLASETMKWGNHTLNITNAGTTYQAKLRAGRVSLYIDGDKIGGFTEYTSAIEALDEVVDQDVTHRKITDLLKIGALRTLLNERKKRNYVSK